MNLGRDVTFPNYVPDTRVSARLAQNQTTRSNAAFEAIVPQVRCEHEFQVLALSNEEEKGL